MPTDHSTALTDLMETLLTEEYEACGDDRDDLVAFFSKFCLDDTSPDLLEHPNWCVTRMRAEIANTVDMFGADTLPQQFRNAIKYDIDEQALLDMVIEWFDEWREQVRQDEDEVESLPDDPEDKTVGYLMPDGRLVVVEN